MGLHDARDRVLRTARLRARRAAAGAPAHRGPGGGSDLNAWIENANDAFFIDDFTRKATFQNTFDLKHELRLTVGSGSVAAASFNCHNDFFCKSFAIELAGGGGAVSGCVGYGLERFVLAVLAQKGLDPAAWPERLQEAMNRETIDV